MLSGHRAQIVLFALLAVLGLTPVRTHAQAALLMEEPYGTFGLWNPTGHNAIYFERVCAETPTRLRRCNPGELGSVLSRYAGINGYDWVAMPLIPYLYSVEDASLVPDQVDPATVNQMRDRYRETHFEPIGLDQPGKSRVRNGWKQLIGASYERRIYAFRFPTTPEQDDVLIARLNTNPNQSHFQLLSRNCSDFARDILNAYYPGAFHRALFPDAGITTPKQLTSSLARYGRKHPELDIQAFMIPQIPGFRAKSHPNKNIASSLTTTFYAVPLSIVNPYLLGGIFVDYVVRGRSHTVPKDPPVVGPDDLATLTVTGVPQQNSPSDGPHAAIAAPAPSSLSQTPVGANSGLQEVTVPNE